MTQPPAQLIEGLNDGKLFHVEFTKRTDGSTRRMTARRLVQKDVIGVGQTYDPSERNLLTVWDIDAEGYRNIPLEAITLIAHHGKEWRAV